MKKLTFVFVLICLASAALQAQDVFQWFGTDPARTGPPTGDWRQPYAWMNEMTGIYSQVPTPNSKVKINNVKWGTNWEQWSPVIGGIYGPLDVAVGDIFIAEGGAGLSPEFLTVGTGGSLLVQGAGGTAEGQVNIGYQAGAVGSLIIDGGTATINGPLHVGWGGTGSVQIKSGSMTVNSFDIGGAGGSGNIDIEAGTLIVNGFFDVDPIIIMIYPPPYLAGLTGYGDPENIRWSYDELTDKTTIWAVPEPASIALLSLGLIFLKKRK